MAYRALENTFWQKLPAADYKRMAVLTLIGFLVGLASGFVVSLFRVTASATYSFVVDFAAGNRASFWAWLILLAVGLCAAFWTGQLMRDPAIESGGAAWIKKTLLAGQPRVLRKILLPKFLGCYLVKGCGVSVGMEGPSVQMGCAAAMSIHNLSSNSIERRYFMLGGCAAGLATAFSAHFAGICYVYEIMREKLSNDLFLFMLAGSLGVYIVCEGLFGLGTMLPFAGMAVPGVTKYWLLFILACFAGAIGAVYNYALRFFLEFMDRQKRIPTWLRPFFAFLPTICLLFIFPEVTGEGMDIFPAMDSGQFPLLFLCCLLLAKLVLTAGCYSTGVPAGQMVPILSIGGIAGAIFSLCCQHLGLMGGEYYQSLIAIGMTAALTASECAPVTGVVLVAQMTGSWSLSSALLFVAAVSYFLARLARVQPI